MSGETENNPEDSEQDKDARISTLESELQALRDEGTPADTDKVEDNIEKSAEEIVDETEDSPVDADEAAKVIADEMQRKGVTFTDSEIKGIAKRIRKAMSELEADDIKAPTDDKPRPRDRAPRSTHFTERQVSLKRKR